MYLLHTDDQKQIVRIERPDEGIVIPIEEGNEEYQEFVSWAKFKFPEFYPNQLPINAVIPFDKKIAIELIRETRRRIAVDLAFPTPKVYRSGHHWLRDLFWTSDKLQEPNFLFISQGSKRWSVRIPAPILSEFEYDLNDDSSAFRRLTNWPITRAFVYLDISDFSQNDALQQAVVIDSLISLIEGDHYWSTSREDWRQDCEAKLCIGDGYIFVFADAVTATWFAADLGDLIEVSVARKKLPVEFHFRMGVHVGEVYCFWDFGRNNWNYIGDAINGGNRVLSAIGKDTDDVVFVSDAVRKSILADREGDYNGLLLKAMDNRGRRKDKHGNPWRVYELNHSDLHWASRTKDDP